LANIGIQTHPSMDNTLSRFNPITFIAISNLNESWRSEDQPRTDLPLYQAYLPNISITWQSHLITPLFLFLRVKTFSPNITILTCTAEVLKPFYIFHNSNQIINISDLHSQFPWLPTFLQDGVFLFILRKVRVRLEHIYKK